MVVRLVIVAMLVLEIMTYLKNNVFLVLFNRTSFLMFLHIPFKIAINMMVVIFYVLNAERLLYPIMTDHSVLVMLIIQIVCKLVMPIFAKNANLVFISLIINVKGV